jgi:steroid 5-alpha reductase family enzyme
MIFMFMKQIIWDKVMLINASVMTLSFVEIESLLKILLMIVSIIYTIVKILYNKEGDSEINNRIRKFFNKTDSDEKS